MKKILSLINMNIRNLSIMNLAREYKRRRERFNGNGNNNVNSRPLNNDGATGATAAIFGVVLLFALVLWIWAIVMLVKYWEVLPEWAKVVGILGVLPIVPVGPIVTIVVVYIGKESGHSRRR
jgi:hypothetical protein